MASVLCLKNGTRFDFGDNCYCYLDDAGTIQFLSKRTVSGCLRILLHNGQWIIDARKCKDTVSASEKVLNDKPRLLRSSSAIINIGGERFLFATSTGELARAYDDLRSISQRRAALQTVDPTQQTDLTLDDDEGGTDTRNLGDGDQGDSPSDWTLSGVAEDVVSREVESLHERQTKKHSVDETPHTEAVGYSTGIDKIDQLAAKQTSSFFTGTFKLDKDGTVTKNDDTSPIEVLDTDLGEATEELFLEQTSKATIQLFNEIDDIDL